MSSEPDAPGHLRSLDPRLSPEARAILDVEVAEILPDYRPAGPAAPAPQHHRHGPPALLAGLGENRPLLVITLGAALVLGGIVALITNSIWALLGALALHAIGTLAVGAWMITLADQREHVHPETAARLQMVGVKDPDRALGDLLEDLYEQGATESSTDAVRKEA